jgi:cation diffusion facilitator CzcD-associated flavoprotein CzcO
MASRMTSSAAGARAVPREVGVAIVGTGFSGLAVAIELRRAGIDDLVLLERAASIGGTWRDNRYPGCACDVPSYLYSFSFAPSDEWTRVYAPWHEIRAYLERCADDFDVRRHVLFERELAEARFDEASARWRLRTRAGEDLSARVLVIATGALSNPAWPRLPGAERFRGVQLHSARWDLARDLRARRVAVVGTGASAVQIVPELQREAARLFVVQRTPAWVLPRHDRAFSRREKAALRYVPGARWLYRQAIYWRLEARHLAFRHHRAAAWVVAWLARRNMARAIRDPALRARLTPSYVPGCKRILLSDDWYPALAEPNVEVIADEAAGLTEDALVLASGRRLEVDAVVYGTGFRVHDHLAGLEVLGRGGASLGALWREKASAYLGTVVAGFPNLFVMSGPNTGLGHSSVVLMFEAQARWIRDAVRLLLERGLATIDVRPEVQATYDAWLGRRLRGTVWSTGCRSWYLDPRGRNTALWPGSATSFRARLVRFRPEDFHLLPAPAPAVRAGAA